MIVTLTANPSLDHTVELAAPLDPGEVQTVVGSHSQAAGKGVNISRAAAAAGIPTVAVLPAAAGDPFVTDLTDAGIEVARVESDTAIRVNLTITDPQGTTTKLNDRGAPLGAAVLDALLERTADAAVGADWVVMAGSLPSRTPAGWYAEVVAAVRRTGARVAVDTSGEPLEAIFAAFCADPGLAPDLMKPNGEELGGLLGLDADDLDASPEATAAAAAQLVARGAKAVLATLGGAGAVLVTADGAWFTAPPPTRVLSTVGAGDSSLFGYLLADLRGGGPAERLASAVAYGSAAAALPGTTIPLPDQVHPDLVTPRQLPFGRSATVIQPG